MSWIDWIILLLPLMFVIYMGYRSRRYVKGVADFLAAGRICGRYVICVADVVGALAVITLVAQVEANYQTGFALTFWNELLAPLGIVMALTGYCTYRYRETRAMSLGQFLEMRYSRGFRIFASALRSFSETVCNMIVPAVSARFFICLLGLPFQVKLFGFEISTFALIVIGVLTLALFIIWCGGTVALIITDALQAILSYPIFMVLVIFVLCNFSWFDQIAPVMADRIPGESFLNPYDIQSLRDFNLFALIVTLMSSILNRASWIGAGATAAGRTPHEQKMAGVLGAWRNGFAIIFYFLMGAVVITVLTHADFSAKAREIRRNLSGRAAEEVIDDAGLRRKYIAAAEALPETHHEIGVDEPYSQLRNPDTPYLDTALSVLREGENGNAKFQEFRTLYFQQMLPITIRHVLPVGLIGLFALLMIMLMLSTDDSRIFSGALTLVQDVILPVYGKALPPRTHLLALRLAAVGIGVIFFLGSFCMAQLDYINLFCVITTSIWLGGAGPVMIGGLYSRYGNTAGAYASLIVGTVVSGGGILMQRNWADSIYPWLERVGWQENIGAVLEAVSGPFHPYVVWRMDAIKFPINSNELFFIAMLLGIAAYCAVSLLTFKEKFNLDRMLHRGIYSDGGESRKTEPNFRSVFSRLIGIDENYTRGDKVIAWSVFAYSFVYSFVVMFAGVFVWNAIRPWPMLWWSWYFFIFNLIVPGIVACISTVWFMIGGIVDLRRMLRDLAARTDNPLDDGRVEGHVSLADIKEFKMREESGKRR